jgi:hypothetical protein
MLVLVSVLSEAAQSDCWLGTGRYAVGGTITDRCRQLREVLRVRPHPHISAGAQGAAGFRPELVVGMPDRIYDWQLYDDELDSWRERERQRRMEALFPEIDFKKPPMAFGV